MAMNDGEDPQRAQAFFNENKFTFIFVPDINRRISALFGVGCWPTTVSVDEKGLVDHIQFGVAPSEESFQPQKTQG
jgi:hypothetical protein